MIYLINKLETLKDINVYLDVEDKIFFFNEDNVQIKDLKDFRDLNLFIVVDNQDGFVDNMQNITAKEMSDFLSQNFLTNVEKVVSYLK